MSATPLSPESFPPGYLAQDRGYQLTSVAIAFIAVESLLVALRFSARRMNISPMGWDDWLIIPALISNIGTCILGLIMVRIAGVGRHLAYVEMENPETLVKWAKCLFALDYLYVVAVALPKLSILCFYLRIFVKKPYKLVTLTLIWIISSHCFSEIIASTFQCFPIAFQWNKTLPGGHCFDQLAFYRWVTFPNIITDVIILILPLPLVWSLNLPQNRKIGLTFVFLTGSVGLIASCVRIAIFFGRNAFSDNTWTSVPLVSWSIIEPGIYLIAACLPSLRPLFLRIISRGGSEKFATAPEHPTASPHPINKPGSVAAAQLGFMKLGNGKEARGDDVWNFSVAESTRGREGPESKWKDEEQGVPLGAINVKKDVDVSNAACCL